MTAHDPLDHAINAMAERATEDVMERLHLIVRQAVQQEVEGELCSQLDAIAERESAVERMTQMKGIARVPTKDLVSAAARVATASVKLENDKYTAGEKSAQRALDAAINDLRTAVRAYQTEYALKGNRS